MPNHPVVTQAQPIGRWLDQQPIPTAIINARRQIVYANSALLELLGLPESAIVGRRFGEAVDCAHADETPSGCGTTDHCATCGALHAQTVALDGRAIRVDCRIEGRRPDESLDLRIWAKPATFGGEPYAVVAMLDVRDEKRREALERTFFHDILNTAGGLKGVATLLLGASARTRAELTDLLARLTTLLVEEIEAHRDLAAMERHDFTPTVELVRSDRVIADVVEQHRFADAAVSRELRVASGSAVVAFHSDPRLVRRVLGNMVKNALEACPSRGVVTIRCERRPSSVVFAVHNPSSMPADVQRQIFQRSFSTKGRGRGIGTYSMRLIAETYLQGHVSFFSSPDEGTTFRAEFPLSPIGELETVAESRQAPATAGDDARNP